MLSWDFFPLSFSGNISLMVLMHLNAIVGCFYFYFYYIFRTVASVRCLFVPCFWCGFSLSFGGEGCSWWCTPKGFVYSVVFLR